MYRYAHALIAYDVLKREMGGDPEVYGGFLQMTEIESSLLP